MRSIQRELLPSLQQLRTLFNEQLDMASSESPPSDPPASPHSIFQHQPATNDRRASVRPSQSFKNKAALALSTKSNRVNAPRAGAKAKPNNNFNSSQPPASANYLSALNRTKKAGVSSSNSAVDKTMNSECDSNMENSGLFFPKFKIK